MPPRCAPPPSAGGQRLRWTRGIWPLAFLLTAGCSNGDTGAPAAAALAPGGSSPGSDAGTTGSAGSAGAVGGQGGAGGASDPGSASGGGRPPQGCSSCVLAHCKSALGGCQSDATCPRCEASPGADCASNAAFQSVLACQCGACGPVCPDACSAAASGGAGGTGAQGGGGSLGGTGADPGGAAGAQPVCPAPNGPIGCCDAAGRLHRCGDLQELVVTCAPGVCGWNSAAYACTVSPGSDPSGTYPRSCGVAGSSQAAGGSHAAGAGGAAGTGAAGSGGAGAAGAAAMAGSGGATGTGAKGGF